MLNNQAYPATDAPANAAFTTFALLNSLKPNAAKPKKPLLGSPLTGAGKAS